MPYSYSIGAIGSDPAFQAAFDSYNSAYQNYITQQNDGTRVAQNYAYQQAMKANPTESATQVMTSSIYKEDNHTFRNLSIAAGAALILYACYKGKKGNPIDGFKTIYNEAKGVWSKFRNSETVAKGSKKVAEILGENVKEYTVKKGGMEIVMQGKNPVKIITADKKVITDPTKVAEWVSNNSAADSLIKGLKVSSGTLPKGVSLSYTKEIVDGTNTYRLVVEQGKVVKAFSKDKADKFIEVAEKDLSAFIKNHAAQVKEAETLTKTTSLDKVRLLNKKGELYNAGTQNITWSVRNGKIVSANIGGRTLKPEEIQALQRDFGKEIKLFGKEAAGTYKDIADFEYIYRTCKTDTGLVPGQRIRFNNAHNITGINSIERVEKTGTDEIKQYLEKHTDLKDNLNSIASNGIFPEGFRLGGYQLKSGTGNVFVLDGNKKLTKILLADGTVVSGDKDIKDWIKIAANGNEYNSVCPAQ